MPETKMSAEEMKSYYLLLHQQAIAYSRQEELGAVIDITANRWVNSFTDYAHRLGMKRVFTVLKDEWGSLAGRKLLDLGCGRGRWSKEYAARGARVTGVDISPDAIRLLAKEMPQHQFICQDIPELNLPPESFDIVSSVTVVQHLPPEKQLLAFSLAAQWIKPGGYLVLLENIMGFDAPHVFPHATDEWIRMVGATGLKLKSSWGSNYEVLFRAEACVLHLLRGNKLPREALTPRMPQTGQRSGKSRLKSGAKAVLAGLSFPIEWACQRVPLATPTHSVMIFSK
jgi:SAM-dependent methyltransferase